MMWVQVRRLLSMPTSDHIKKNRSDPDELDFDSLRKEAIGYVQDLCGETWTDYNLHDPGVTILEQICYGLTDLSYRSGFKVQDYLANKTKEIDYERQALFSPQDILPSSPVTKADYEKMLYDAIPEIKNIWFEPSADKNFSTALYTVLVKIDDDLFQTPVNELKKDTCLSEKARRLRALYKILSTVQGALYQIGSSLDGKHNILKKWCSRIEYSVSINAFDELIDRGNKVLSLLDNILSLLENIRNKLDDIWSVLVDSQQASVLVSGLDNTLSKLEDILGRQRLIAQLGRINSMLAPDFPKPEELVPILNKLLPKLVQPFSKFETILHKMDTDLSRISKEMLMSDEISEDAVKQQKEFFVKQKILSIFARQRSLCEDIHSVKIIKTVPYFLVGEVEIYTSQNPAKVYAEILFKCIQHISSGIQIDRYEAVFSKENSYDNIFTGPLTTHGFINDKYFEVTKKTLSVVDLVALISQIDGVSQIHNLSLMDQKNQKHMNVSYVPSEDEVIGLCFPRVGKAMQILRLVFPQNTNTENTTSPIGFESLETQKDDLLLEESKLELKKLIFEYHAFRSNSQSWKKFIQLPKGQSYELQNYYSIQNHFPAIYGVNQYGIPRSKSPDIKAKAKQLKAYLFPYEQVMANYLKNLQEIPRLFSLDTGLKQSYFSQFLSNQNISDIEALYVGEKANMQPMIAEILAYYDEFSDRRNRVLDTLLAIYGEQFGQQSLQHFNHYRKKDTEEWVIENKIKLLEHLKEISRDRANGFDYLTPSFHTEEFTLTENTPGIHKKIGILLGLSRHNCAQFMTHILTRRSSRLVDDDVLFKKIKCLSKDQQREAIPVPDLASAKVKVKMPSKLPYFSYEIFKAGVELKNYCIVHSGQEATVCFRVKQDDRLLPLASKNSFDEAVLYAHQFCNTITQLNMESENFHFLEHLLLRPRSCDSFSGFSNPEVFYNFRVSVIFPSWTTRFSEKKFRRFAEETVQKNLPAHIFPDFYWLDFSHMQDFEQRYKIWIQLMRQSNQEHNDSIYYELDHASKKIISFLLSNQHQSECERWV